MTPAKWSCQYLDNHVFERVTSCSSAQARDEPWSRTAEGASGDPGNRKEKGMKRTLRALLTAAGLLALSISVQAQSTTGRISGTVLDSQGGVLPGATIVVT